MTFERVTDHDLLNSLVRNPSLYPFLGDDFAPAIEDAAVVEHPAIWYILGRDGEDLLGFWMFAPDNGNTVCWQFHTVMPLDRRALAATRGLLGPGGWLWENTPCLRAVTNVPAYNAIALRFGLRAGLTEYGRNPQSYMKHGQLQAQILLGISRA